jgi:hypothetical protein
VTPEQLEERRRKDREYKRAVRALLPKKVRTPRPQMSLEERRERSRKAKAQQRANMTPEQRAEARRAHDAAYREAHREQRRVSVSKSSNRREEESS